MTISVDLPVLGHRIRHFRLARGLTLSDLGMVVGAAPSQLSLIENGKREPRLTLLTDIADHLGIALNDLLVDEAPDRRSALELEVARIQAGTLYASLGLPVVKPTAGTPTETLEA